MDDNDNDNDNNNEFISYKKIIIFGSKGSGKTTLIKLMGNDINIKDMSGSFFIVNFYKTEIELEKSIFLYLRIYEIRIDSKFINNVCYNIDSILYECQYALFLVDMTDMNNFQLIKELINNINLENFPYLSMKLIINKKELNDLVKIKEDDLYDFSNLKPLLKIHEISLNKSKIKELLFERFNNSNDCKISSNLVLEPNYKNKTHFSFEKYNDLNIILFGDDEAVGKSVFLYSYLYGIYNEYILSSIGYDKSAIWRKIKDHLFKINIFDTSGKERFKNFFPHKLVEKGDVF